MSFWLYRLCYDIKPTVKQQKKDNFFVKQKLTKQFWTVLKTTQNKFAKNINNERFPPMILGKYCIEDESFAIYRIKNALTSEMSNKNAKATPAHWKFHCFRKSISKTCAWENCCFSCLLLVALMITAFTVYECKVHIFCLMSGEVNWNFFHPFRRQRRGKSTFFFSLSHPHQLQLF